VDNVLLIWRNKKKEHDRQVNGGTADVMTPDMRMMCEKQRNGEHEEWYNFWYHRESQQFIENWDDQPMEFK
jgi:hypothetical protein